MMHSLRTSRKTRWTLTVVGITLMGLGTLWGVGQVGAFNPQPDPPAFGLVGLNPDQTARLKVVCSNIMIGEIPPGSCRVNLMFSDISGNILKRAAVTLAPGQGAFLDLAGSEVTFGRDETRFEFEPNNVPAPGSGRVIPTLEVFDSATGRTDLFINPVAPRLSLIQSLQSPSTSIGPGQ